MQQDRVTKGIWQVMETRICINSQNDIEWLKTKVSTVFNTFAKYKDNKAIWILAEKVKNCCFDPIYAEEFFRN